MENVIIRNATAEDMTAVHALIVELAVYEKEPDAVETTVEELTRDGFGAHPKFECFVAEDGERVIGFALTYTNYSTWKGASMYLEDLCVSEAYRGKGIGGLLFERVIKEAQDRGVRRMDWQVLDWNEPAIGFYKKYGATLDPGWLNGRFFEEDLKRLKQA